MRPRPCRPCARRKAVCHLLARATASPTPQHPLPPKPYPHPGDSRAVLVRGGAIAAATDDHRPGGREDEAERVARAGGAVLFNGGLRLMGVLAVTRAIGDHDLQPYGLTPEPEVLHLRRSPEDEFLVGSSLMGGGCWGAGALGAWGSEGRGGGGCTQGAGSPGGASLPAHTKCRIAAGVGECQPRALDGS
jgi:hypothetical protein